MKPMTIFTACFFIGFGLLCGAYTAKAIHDMSEATGNYAYYQATEKIPDVVRCKGER